MMMDQSDLTVSNFMGYSLVQNGFSYCSHHKDVLHCKIARKTVFGVCADERLKAAFSATETS